MRATHMEDVLVGISTVGCMAIDAHARHLRVLDNRPFAKRGQLALVKPHLAIHFVTRCYLSVGQAIILQGIIADVDGEVAISCPLSTVLNAYRTGQLAASIVLQQAMPRIDVEVGIRTLYVDGLPMLSLQHHVHTLRLARTTEIQRSNAHGYGHLDIVGKYRRQVIHLTGILHLLAARCQEQGQHDDCYPAVVHHCSFIK